MVLIFFSITVFLITPKKTHGDRANYTLRHPADVKADLSLDFQNFQEMQEKARDLSSSNRSKPIRVCSDDRIPRGYSLPDFQQI